MAKPSKPTRHGKLSTAIRKSLEEHGYSENEHRYTIPAASDALLEKLAKNHNWPKEKLGQAKQIEAHTFRIFESLSAVDVGRPLRVGTARIIVQKAIEEIPDFVKHNTHRLSPEEQRQCLEFRETLKKEVAGIQNVPDNLPTTLSHQFLLNARDFHMDQLRHLLGEQQFDTYNNAARRTFRPLLSDR